MMRTQLADLIARCRGGPSVGRSTMAASEPRLPRKPLDRQPRRLSWIRRWRPTPAWAACAGLAMLGGVLHAAPPTGVVFTSFDGLFQVFSVRVDGSQRRQLTQGIKVYGWTAGSPDGTRIAFTSGIDDDTAIWMMDPDGGGQQRVFAAPTRDLFPTWSPDGENIAFNG